MKIFEFSRPADAPAAIATAAQARTAQQGADVRFVANEALKETDAGEVVIPWILAEAPARIVVDEYHHGFGATTSVWKMLALTMRWLGARPAGWAVLHLTLVGLAALAVATVRFGPARSAIERRRRSPLEHLEALAVGLERAHELSILRTLGFTPRGLGATLLTQTGLLGFAAGLAAIPIGAGLAALLVHVINRRSFGWSMELALNSGAVASGLMLAVGAALLAGLYPAWRASRIELAAGLRED